MKFFSTSLFLIYLTIGILTVLMIWNYSNFQRSMKNVSFNLPEEATRSITDDYNKMMNGDIPAPIQKFSSPDGYFSFEYPATWISLNSDGDNASSTEKIIFSASKVSLKSMSLSYFIVKESSAKNLQETIDALKKETSTAGISPQINELEIATNNRETIPVFESVYQIMQGGQATNALSSINAVISTENKSYIISILSDSNNWTQTRAGAEEIFKSITINSLVETKTRETTAE
jgi:hypothetical protein